MKRKAVVLLLVVAILLAAMPIASARGAIAVSGGLTKVSGSTYSLWGEGSTATPEDISVYVYLYKNGTYVDGVSSSDTNVKRVKAAKNVTIATGNTYVVEVYAYGNTNSGGMKYTYNF